MALVRDSKRLERLAKNLLLSNNSKDDSDGQADLAALEQAADYVINFNMAGLFRIQSQRSAKFLREHLCDEDSSIGLAETDAFRKVADKLDEYRVQSENAGKLLVSYDISVSCVLSFSLAECDPIKQFIRLIATKPHSMNRLKKHPHHHPNQINRNNNFSVTWPNQPQNYSINYPPCATYTNLS